MLGALWLSLFSTNLLRNLLKICVMVISFCFLTFGENMSSYSRSVISTPLMCFDMTLHLIGAVGRNFNLYIKGCYTFTFNWLACSLLWFLKVADFIFVLINILFILVLAIWVAVSFGFSLIVLKTSFISSIKIIFSQFLKISF